MNLYEQFNKLGKQQIAFQEGLDLLKENSASLKGISESMDVWGTIAVASNVALIPLNVIVNAFELGAVKDLYQVVVKQLYGKFAKSGTRLDGDPKVALSILKKAIIDLLKKTKAGSTGQCNTSRFDELSGEVIDGQAGAAWAY